MTTIAVDVRSGLLACDSFQEHNGTLLLTSCLKGIIFRDGSIGAWAGDHQDGLLWAEWMERAELLGKGWESRPDTWQSLTALHLTKAGLLYRYDLRGVPVWINEPFYGIGIGSDWAMAAMACGKGLLEAMRLTCHYSPYTCGPIRLYDLKAQTMTSYPETDEETKDLR